MNYTEFGKELKKILIDNNSKIYDFAQELGVTSAFVSSVICGKKSVPDDWIPTIVNKYNLTHEQEQLLIDKMISTKKTVVFDLSKLNNIQKQFTYQLQRNLSNLSNAEIEELEKIMGGNKLCK